MNRTSRFDVRMLVIIAMVAITPGCLFSPDKGKPKPVPDEYQPRSTIAGVLANLVTAYKNEDLDRYKVLFDQEQFMFVFDPVDVQDDPDIPPNWGWAEEENSTRNMFEADLVEKIKLDFVPGLPVDVIESDILERSFPEGTKKVIVTEVALDVDTRDPDGGENIVFRVSGDQAIFFLYQDGELENGLPVWKIFEWRDKKIGARPVPVAS